MRATAAGGWESENAIRRSSLAFTYAWTAAPHAHIGEAQVGGAEHWVNIFEIGF